MTTPTEVLKHEHEIIQLVLRGAEREALRIQEGGPVDAEKVDKMVAFFRNFTDLCHHAKEERLLFVKMQERGASAQGSLIEDTLREHEQGRRLVRAVAEALPQAARGDREAAVVVADHLVRYVQLLAAHIDKEDNTLFPLADQILTPEDRRDLGEEFDRIEAEEMGEGVHEQYHQLAHDLAG